MKALRWAALSAGALMADAILHSWPEIRRYMRIRAM
jgi:hypothetical protein